VRPEWLLKPGRKTQKSQLESGSKTWPGHTHVRRCSAQLVLREMRIKTAMGCHSGSIGTVKNMLTSPNAGEDAEKLDC
jgi:hypothetical protein